MKSRFLKCIICFLTVIGFTDWTSSTAKAFDLDEIVIHGFVSQGYLKSTGNNIYGDTKDGTFDFFESAISFSTEPYENLRVGLQLMSRDLGHSGNMDLFMDLAYADYRWKDYLGFRAGLIRVPIGLYNKDRDLDFLRTSIFLPQSIYDENYRTFRSSFRGAGIYGNLPMGAIGDLDYELLMGTPELDKNEPFFKNMFYLLAGGQEQDRIDLDMTYAYAAALRWNTPIDGLRFGITQLNTVLESEMSFDAVIQGMDFAIDMDIEIDYDYFYVLSAEYAVNRLKLTGEYCRKKQVTSGSSIATSSLFTRSESFKYNQTAELYYGGISYRFSDLLELGTYYSLSYPDIDNRTGTDNRQKDWTISVRLDLLPSMTLKFETHFIEGTADILNYNNPDSLDKHSVLYAAKCSVNF
jgi:hypothetical protein